MALIFSVAVSTIFTDGLFINIVLTVVCGIHLTYKAWTTFKHAEMSSQGPITHVYDFTNLTHRLPHLACHTYRPQTKIINNFLTPSRSPAFFRQLICLLQRQNFFAQYLYTHCLMSPTISILTINIFNYKLIVRRHNFVVLHIFS